MLLLHGSLPVENCSCFDYNILMILSMMKKERGGLPVEDYIYRPDNSRDAIQLRHWRDALAISGSAEIALSVWDILKLFIGLFFGEETVQGMVSATMKEIDVPKEAELVFLILSWVIILGILIIACIFIFFYHYYIGINAYRAGRQTAKKKKKGYLVLAFLSLTFSCFLIIFNFITFLLSKKAVSNVNLTTMLIEVVALLNYVYLLTAAFNIRKLERKQGGSI